MIKNYKIGAMLVLLVLYSSQSFSAGTAKNLKCKGCVGSSDIAKNAVTGSRIKKNAITGDKIKNGSISELDLSPVLQGDISALGTGQDSNDSRIDALEAGSVSVHMSHLQDDNIEDTTCKYRKDGGGIYLEPGAGVVCPDLYMGVTLPHGRTLTGLYCYAVDDDGSSNNIDGFDLERMHMATSVLSPVFEAPSTLNGTGIQMVSDTTAAPGRAVVDNGTYAYLIQVGIDVSDSGLPADIKAIACRITYQ
jgi:hypothetical protein